MSVHVNIHLWIAYWKLEYNWKIHKIDQSNKLSRNWSIYFSADSYRTVAKVIFSYDELHNCCLCVQSVMERVARFTQAGIVNSIDGLVSRPTLGLCHSFRVKTYTLPSGKSSGFVFYFFLQLSRHLTNCLKPAEKKRSIGDQIGTSLWLNHWRSDLIFLWEPWFGLCEGYAKLKFILALSREKMFFLASCRLCSVSLLHE